MDNKIHKIDSVTLYIAGINLLTKDQFLKHLIDKRKLLW
jgi:hypothetical protein